MLFKSNWATVSIIVSIVINKPVRCAPIDDANAGLKALRSGDSKDAIRLLSGAISHGGLSPSDLEFAYVVRGNAYLQMDEPDNARRDADSALLLKPTDADAKALWEATTIERAPHNFPPRAEMVITYTCDLQNSSGHVNPIIVKFNKNQSLVEIDNMMERGRMLSVSRRDNVLFWQWHVEGVGADRSGSSGGFVYFNVDTGLMTETWEGSDGSRGMHYFRCSRD